MYVSNISGKFCLVFYDKLYIWIILLFPERWQKIARKIIFIEVRDSSAEVWYIIEGDVSDDNNR
jgi:hypothetical protein